MRNSDGASIDIAGNDRPAQRLCRCDGKDPASRSDVEHGGVVVARAVAVDLTVVMAMFCDEIERQQTSKRAGVMAGTKGEPGIDLDCAPVSRKAPPVVTPMHDEGARFDRTEPFLAYAHPIHGRKLLKYELFRRAFARDQPDERAHGLLLGPPTKVKRNRPASLRLFRNRGRTGAIVGRLADSIADAQGRPLVRCEPCNPGGGVATWKL